MLLNDNHAIIIRNKGIILEDNLSIILRDHQSLIIENNRREKCVEMITQ